MLKIMKKNFFIISVALLGVTIISVANNQKNENVAPRAIQNRKITDTLKDATFQRLENGQVLTINTWQRSCPYGGSESCDSGTYTEKIVI
ncbi:hypothetical protein DW036_20830 [Bacteroides sp. AF39-11AC]|jgi:hypothetical protein|nr:hypothetical protein DW036_20830 [Bacteroides sp. AF39-11AC]